MAPSFSKAALFLVALSCPVTCSKKAISAGKAHRGQAARGRHGDRHDASSGGSLAQIIETLRNLRGSIDDMGREEDSLSSEAASRCTTALQLLATESQASSVAMARLHMDLEEQTATVEEAEAAAQQVHADVALVQITLNRTEEMLQAASVHPADFASLRTDENSLALQAMAAAKRQTLSSLQGELEVVLPALAQLQGRESEMKKRLDDGERSMESTRLFATALRDGCALGDRRAATRATARTSEQSFIDTALQALQEPAPAASKTSSQEQDGSADADASNDGADADTDDAADGDVSFVQVASEHDDDVDEEGDESEAAADDASSDASADTTAAPETQQPTPAQTSEEDGPSEADLVAAFSENDGSDRETIARVMSEDHAPKPAVLKPEIQHQLGQLKSMKHASAASKRQWCEDERSRSQLSLRVAKASAGEMLSEADVHSEAEVEFGESLVKTQGALSLVKKAAAEFAQGSSKEAARLAASSKDQALATRILKQAIAILEDLHGSKDGHNSKATHAAAEALRSAKQSLEGQNKVLKEFKAEVQKTSTSVTSISQQALADLQNEHESLLFTKESHGAERFRSMESKRLFDSEMAEAEQYAQDLEEECRADSDEKEDHEEDVEEHALQDAESVLEGKSIAHLSATLRGSFGGARPTNAAKLSPLERAAAEIGVAVEDA